MKILPSKFYPKSLNLCLGIGISVAFLIYESVSFSCSRDFSIYRLVSGKVASSVKGA